MGCEHGAIDRGLFGFLVCEFPLLYIHVLSKNSHHWSFLSNLSHRPFSLRVCARTRWYGFIRCGTRRTSSACRRSTPPTGSR